MNFLDDLIYLRTFFFIIIIYSIQENFVLSSDYLSHFPLKSKSFPLPVNLLNNPINDIAFDNEGIMYISSGNAVYIGNGITWEKINTLGLPFFATDTENVYLYTINDAGIITSDSIGRFIFKSFGNHFKEQSISLSNIKDLAVFQGTVLLITGSQLLIIKEDSISVEDPDFEGGKIFNTKNNIIIYKPDSGFRKIGINSSSVYVKHNFNPDIFLEYSKGYLTYFKDENRFFKLNPDFIIEDEWVPALGEKITFAEYSDEYFFFGSENNDLYIFSSEGKRGSLPETIISLQNEPLKGMKFAGNKLWLIKNGRLSYLEYPPVFINSNFFDIPGNILSSAIFNDDIYLGTDEGLFLISPVDKIPLMLLSGICRKLINTQTAILALTDKGIYSFGNNKTNELFNGFAGDLAYDHVNQQIIISLANRIIAMKISEDKALMQKTILTGHNPGILHVYDPYIYFTDEKRSGRISPRDEFPEPKFLQDIPGESILKIFTYLDKPHLLTKRSIFLIHEDLSLSKIEVTGISTDNSFYDITVYHGNSCWIQVTNPSGRFKLYQNNDTYSFTQITTPLSNDTYPFTIYSDIANRYLISSGNHCFVLNPYHLPLKDLISTYHVLINKIIAGQDTIFDGLINSLNMHVFQARLDNLPYKNRYLQFELSSTNYSQADVLYKYTLQGKNEQLSECLSHPLIELKNLKEGKYSLIITSHDTYQNISTETVFSFKILPPLYQKWWAILLYILILFIVGFIIYKHFKIKNIQISALLSEDNVSELVTKEISKSDLFSETIKPSPSDKSKWEKFEIATVLFSDIQGFTKIAEQMNPEKLIDELDKFFFHFDSVCEKYDIEKIKTIGDAYMAAGGIPRQNSTNPVEVVLAALEMQHYMKQLKKTKTDMWDLRIGIHSGPIIGGIIGYKKRSYDIWGDTVNIASRMESSGEPGKVNISETTYQLIKDFYICEYRGKLPVKYKGNIAMYFVKGLRPELSVNLGAMPNRTFFLKLQSVRLKDLEYMIVERLKSELPENLYFHSRDYIKHIYDHACLLSNAESLNLEDSILIKTSALLIFTGLITKYQNYENKSAEIARELLPGFKYSNNQINSISNLILFSKLQHEPQNYLEKIIYDLKTEHYGRADYLKLYKRHFLEVIEHSEKITIQEWQQNQIRFLQKHNFYTLSAQRLREILPGSQIKKIKSDKWK